jgi:hypothetical protein
MADFPTVNIQADEDWAYLAFESFDPAVLQVPLSDARWIAAETALRKIASGEPINRFEAFTPEERQKISEGLTESTNSGFNTDQVDEDLFDELNALEGDQ